MTRHRYPWPALRGDYIRAAAGIALTGAPLATAPGGIAAPAILGGLCAIFVLFAARTGLRHASVFECDDGALRRGGPLLTVLARPILAQRRAVSWRELEHLRLRFYTTRRDRSGGWMQMTLAGGGGRVSLDSSLAGFETIARRAAEAAARNGIALNDATLGNLGAMGIRVGKSAAGETE